MKGRISLVFLLSFCGFCRCKSPSEDGVQHALETEQQFIQELEKYLVMQEARVNRIEKFVNKLGNLSDDADKHGILHPAMAFLHTKVLSRDLDDLMDFLTTNREAERHALLLESLRSDLAGDPAARALARARRLTTALHFDIPQENDLRDAAMALHELQTEFGITAQKLADGEVPTSKISTKMTVDEIFTVGIQLFDAEMYESSSEWFALVLQKCLDEDTGRVLSIADEDCTESVIATCLARSGFVHFVEGNTTAAVLQTAEALTFEETNEEALAFLKMFYSHETSKETLLTNSKTGKKTEL